MTLAVARAITCEDDSIICAVNRRDVVIVCRLVRNFRNYRSRIRIHEIRDFIKLPVIDGIVVVLCFWCANHHAEHCLRTAPMNARLANGDSVGVLRSPQTISRGSGEVFKSAVRVSDVEVAATSAAIRSRAVIAKKRADRRKISGNGDLGDKQDGVGRTGVSDYRK